MHYTFRHVAYNTYECAKWEDGRLIEVYEIQPNGKRRNANMCSCLSRVPCKHLDMVLEMIECDCMKEHWLWYFENGQWHTAYDQQDWITNV